MSGAAKKFALIVGEAPGTLAYSVENWISFKARDWTEGSTYYAKLCARAWRSTLGHLPMSEIGPLEIQKLYQARDDCGYAATSLNRERKLFMSFWTWGLSMEIVQRMFPKVGWPRKAGGVQRLYRCYTIEEEKRLCRCLKPRYVRLVRFLISTGLRIGEVEALMWDWIIEAEDGLELFLPAAVRKQRKDLRVPLSAVAAKAMGRRPRSGGLVFGWIPHRSGVNSVLKRAAKESGLGPEISVHQFRRTFIGRLQRAGYANSLIKFLIGSTSERILDFHYTTPLSGAEARKMLEKIHSAREEK